MTEFMSPVKNKNFKHDFDNYQPKKLDISDNQLSPKLSSKISDLFA